MRWIEFLKSRVPSLGQHVVLAAPFAGLAAAIALLILADTQMVAASRIYMEGQSRWSAAQNDAVLRLHRFQATGDAAELEGFESDIAVSLGHRVARLQLERDKPDYELARQGFLASGFDLVDAQRAIGIFRLLRGIPDFDRAVVEWARGDIDVENLRELARLLQERAPERARRDAATLELLYSIDATHRRLSRIDAEFSWWVQRTRRRISFAVSIAAASLAAFLCVMGLFLQGRVLRRAREAESGRAVQLRRDAVLADIGREARDCWDLPALRSFAGARLEAPPRAGCDAGTEVFSQTTEHMLALAEQRSALKERLTAVRHFDTLTSLPNRRALMESLDAAIGAARRNGTQVAVLFVDLDHFRRLNHAFGHEAGDRVLLEVARRLRDMADGQWMPARMGGDEFCIVLGALARPEAALQVVERVLHACAEPVEAGGVRTRLTASIGVATFPRDGDEAAVLLQRADTAMYLAKEDGGGRYRYCAPILEASLRHHIRVEAGLGQALERGELRLVYQPIVDLASGELLGAEALLRWDHPEWGLTAPDRFIEAAERSGLIVPIGEWVLHQAIAQLAQLHAAGLPGLRMSVNISARQLISQQLPATLKAALDASAVMPECVELEITESMLVEEPVRAGEVLRQLRRIGVTLALDDFGTGCSALSYLRELPIDAVKIDRSFLSAVTDDAEDAAVARGMIALAKGVRLAVTGEGVETQAQAAFLRRCGCDRAQGFLFGGPMASGELIERWGLIPAASRRASGRI